MGQMPWGKSRPGELRVAPPIPSCLSPWGGPCPWCSHWCWGDALGMGGGGTGVLCPPQPCSAPGGWGVNYFSIQSKTLLQEHGTLWLLGRRGGGRGVAAPIVLCSSPGGHPGGSWFLGGDGNQPQSPSKAPAPSPQRATRRGKGLYWQWGCGRGAGGRRGPLPAQRGGQRECPVSMGERREEALNTTSCACARLALPGQRRG